MTERHRASRDCRRKDAVLHRGSTGGPTHRVGRVNERQSPALKSGGARLRHGEVDNRAFKTARCSRECGPRDRYLASV